MTLHAPALPAPAHARPVPVQPAAARPATTSHASAPHASAERTVAPHVSARRVPVPPAGGRLAARVVALTLVVAGAVGVPAPGPASAAHEGAHATDPAAAPAKDPAAPATDPAAAPATDPATAVLAASAVAAPAVLAQIVVTERLPLAFRTVRREDPSRSRGVEAVVRAGRAGVLERTHVDLGVAGRVPVQQRRLLEPVDRVVAVGTRPRATYGGLGWASLARCESGGDPRAVSRTGRFRGLYQFSRSTWRSVGGVGDPAAHSRDSQTAHAWTLYQRDGRAPWPECGRHL